MNPYACAVRYMLKFWDVVKKLAMLANIGAFVFVIAWSIYNLPPSAQPILHETQSTRWMPSIIVGGCLVLASIFNLIAFLTSRRFNRRALASQITVLETSKNELANQLHQAGINYADANRERLNAVNQT
jgi:hypothetical protein